jgi:hypothetical protein
MKCQAENLVAEDRWLIIQKKKKEKKKKEKAWESIDTDVYNLKKQVSSNLLKSSHTWLQQTFLLKGRELGLKEA